MPVVDGSIQLGGARATVLVVDDESHISHVVSLKLRQAGLRVVVATDGEEALDAALAERPSLVITDYQMPFINGLELAKRLRADPALSATPVLMVTARGHLLPAEELAQTNIKAVMCKPFAPRILLQKALELLGLPGAESAGDAAPGAAAA
jgi:two-component system, OmpR family, alkaline phosphatase synthesis response regulator PhoP